MTREKSTLVVALMTTMLLAILIFMFMLGVKVVFYIICAGFALVGLICADAWMLDWLCDKEEEKNLTPVNVRKDPDPILEDEPEDADIVQMTYDQIRHELELELGGDEL